MSLHINSNGKFCIYSVKTNLNNFHLKICFFGHLTLIAKTLPLCSGINNYTIHTTYVYNLVHSFRYILNFISIKLEPSDTGAKKRVQGTQDILLIIE